MYPAANPIAKTTAAAIVREISFDITPVSFIAIPFTLSVQNENQQAVRKTQRQGGCRQRQMYVEKPPSEFLSQQTR